MNKRLQKLIICGLTTSMAFSICLMMTGCSVDFDRLEGGLRKIGEAFTSSNEDASEGEEDATDIEAVITPIIEITPTEEPTPTPVVITVTPTIEITPTPTPAPERVDFSSLETVEIMDGFNVSVEEFSESVVDENSNPVCSFAGNRMVVEIPNAPNVQTAMNLYLDGFYYEAEGLYNRYANNAMAENSLPEVLGDTIISNYSVNLDYSYSNNSRIISIAMSYSVTDNITGDQEESCVEYISFDMLTGQTIGLDDLTNRSSDLYESFTLALNSAMDIQNAQTNPTPEPTNGVTPMPTAPSAYVFDEIQIMFQQPGAETCTAEIYGIVDGQAVIHTTIDFNQYSQYLNRYAMIVLELV